MLSYHQLLFLKEQYPHHQLLHFIFGHREFVFRTLNRKEYEYALKSATQPEEIEDVVCQLGLIYPEDWRFEQSPMAGVSKTVFPHLIEQSGSQSLDLILTVYEEEKKRILRFEEDCMNLVKAAMPEYSYDEMEEWTWAKLAKMVARAERLFELRGDDSIKIIRNDEEVQEELNHLTMDNKEFVNELREQGVDPMLYFDECKPQKTDLVDFPLIGGIHWQDEEVLYEIQRQMAIQTTKQ